MILEHERGLVFTNPDTGLFEDKTLE